MLRRNASKKRPSRPYRRRPLNIRRRPRLLRNVAAGRNVAIVREDFDFNVTAGQTFDFAFQLSKLQRAVFVAPNFQEYRVTGIKLMFKPKYDTFAGDATGAAVQLPYLWYINDYANVLPTTLSYSSLRSLGVKPIRFDDKTIVKTLKPAVVVLGAQTPGLPSIIRKSPFLPVNATPTGTWSLNDVVHYGSHFQITQMTPTDTQNYVVTAQVTVQFRRPAISQS